MDLGTLNRFVIPLSLVVFFGLGMVWPTLRTWRRTGVWPVTLHRTLDPVERCIGVAMKWTFVALGVWGVGIALGGAAVLSVWDVPAAVVLTGWAVMALGLGVLLVAQAQMGTAWRVGIDEAPTPLVTHGLFGVVRNPIFTAMGAMLVGLVLATPSPWTVAVALYALTLIALQTRLEERHLLALHGETYRRWASSVGRFVPSMGRLAPPRAG